MMNPSSLSMFHMGQIWHHQKLAEDDLQFDSDLSDMESDAGDLDRSMSDFNDSLLSVDDLDDLDDSSTEDEVDNHFLFNTHPSEFGAKLTGKKTPQDTRKIYENGDEKSQNDNRITATNVGDDSHFNWLLRGQPLHYNSTGPPPPISLSGTKSSISNDSLAFTLVYCSVFTLTLMYIAFKISRKWKNNRQGSAPRPRSESQHCNHAACQEVRNSESILPYTGLGAIWIPEIMSFQTPISNNCQPAMHNSRLCNNQCDRCKQLALPPPSYTKLFLEENPPTYTDAVLVMECSGTSESCQLASCKLHHAASQTADGATAPLITVDQSTECSVAAQASSSQDGGAAPLITIDRPAAGTVVRNTNVQTHPLDSSLDSSDKPRIL